MDTKRVLVAVQIEHVHLAGYVVAKERLHRRQIVRTRAVRRQTRLQPLWTGENRHFER